MSAITERSGDHRRGRRAGLAYSGLGPAHHACEDISLPALDPEHGRDLPGLSAMEVRGALARGHAAGLRPVYIRMGKKGEPVVHKGPIADFTIGQAITISDGTDGNCLPARPATCCPKPLRPQAN